MDDIHKAAAYYFQNCKKKLNLLQKNNDNKPQLTTNKLKLAFKWTILFLNIHNADVIFFPYLMFTEIYNYTAWCGNGTPRVQSTDERLHQQFLHLVWCPRHNTRTLTILILNITDGVIHHLVRLAQQLCRLLLNNFPVL